MQIEPIHIQNIVTIFTFSCLGISKIWRPLIFADYKMDGNESFEEFINYPYSIIKKHKVLFSVTSEILLSLATLFVIQGSVALILSSGIKEMSGVPGMLQSAFKLLDDVTTGLIYNKLSIIHFIVAAIVGTFRGILLFLIFFACRYVISYVYFYPMFYFFLFKKYRK